MGKQAKPQTIETKFSGVFKALAKIVSKDATRRNLQFVRVTNVDDARGTVRLDATDGHCLVSVRMVDDADTFVAGRQTIPDGLYLPKDTADRLALGAPLQAATDPALTFPHVDHVIPQTSDDPRAMSWCVNPELLSRTMDAMTAAVDAVAGRTGATRYGHSVQVRPPATPLAPIRLDVTGDGIAVIGVVMPMRM